ncbi:energy transducer TonB [Dyella sp.]|uniref:energy transducer TonB n=1 Tax=Dyella sp. TaxID=1869338 RepID=UPI002ED39A23
MMPLLSRITRGLALALLVAPAVPALAQTTQFRKVPPERLENYWIVLNTQVDADMPNTGRNLDKPGCVAVSYVIGSEGNPTNIEVAKVVPDSDLGSAAKSMVARFHYGPSLSNKDDRQPIATYYVVSFNLPSDPAQAKQISAACQLPGYH